MDTDRNYARFYALLARLPGADKDELVYRFTDGRTTHLHLTTPDEYDVLCRRLEQLSGLDRQRETYLRERRRLRSSALHQLQLLGVDTADWDRVNAYCRDPRIHGRLGPRERLLPGPPHCRRPLPRTGLPRAGGADRQAPRHPPEERITQPIKHTES